MARSSSEDQLSRRTDLLRNVPMFAALEEKDLEKLVDDFHLKTYGKQEMIFRQGEFGNELYIILKGKVRIYKLSPSGAETSINVFSTYDIFGEFAVIDNGPRSAAAKAVVPTKLLAIHQEKFIFHMRAIPDLAMALTKLLTDKLRWTAAYAEAATRYDAAGRLLHILLLYNKKFGKVQEEGNKYTLDLSLNQTDLASLVGARREWVNRLLRSWRKRGLIEYKSGKIIFLDLPQVEAERDRHIEATQADW